MVACLPLSLQMRNGLRTFKGVTQVHTEWEEQCQTCNQFCFASKSCSLEGYEHDNKEMGQLEQSSI